MLATLSERRAHLGLLAAVFLMTVPLAALAQGAWPNKPVKLIVAAGAGSSVDVFARVIGERLSQSLGQPLIVEARAGANGGIAATSVAQSKGDGYTLLFAGNSALVIHPLMTKHLGYNADKDLVAVAPVVYVPLALGVSVDHPARTLQELITMAKAKEMFFATPGSASPMKYSSSLA